MRYEAFIDGSFKELPERGIAFYASAAIIAREGTSDWTSIVQCGGEPQYLKLRNVAGEVFAAMQICEYCLNNLKLGTDDLLRVNYDYAGIANWLKKPGDAGYWRAKSDLASLWRTYFFTYVRPRFRVEFVHTKGHSGIRGNEIVDQLARDAVNRHLQELAAKE
ncbi:MAG: hypothetical protein NC548_11285 [Lachnospiraceae bacterium]|nr:hypothetical protein [Lachnospiraceae bacterium]